MAIKVQFQKIRGEVIKNLCVEAQTKYFNPLTPKVKPWVIKRFLTFDSMYKTPKV